jgi:hypothetical protein
LWDYLENHFWLVDNINMGTVLKKPARKQQRSVQKVRNKPSAKGKRNLDSRAEDAAQRKKIGKTLDVAAFLAHHRQNSASSAHWETEH